MLDQAMDYLAERRRVLMTRDNLRDLAALLLVGGGVGFALAHTPARTLAAWAIGAIVAGVGVVATSREEYVQVKGVGAVLRRKQGPMWQLDDEDCAATPARLRSLAALTVSAPAAAESLAVVVPCVPAASAPGPQPEETLVPQLEICACR